MLPDATISCLVVWSSSSAQIGALNSSRSSRVGPWEGLGWSRIRILPNMLEQTRSTRQLHATFSLLIGLEVVVRNCRSFVNTPQLPSSTHRNALNGGTCEGARNPIYQKNLGAYHMVSELWELNSNSSTAAQNKEARLRIRPIPQL